MNKSVISIFFMVAFLFLITNVALAESSNPNAIFLFDSSLKSSIEPSPDYELGNKLFQVSEVDKSEPSENEAKNSQTKLQTQKNTPSEKNNKPLRTTMRNNKIVQVQDKPWAHQSYFMLGMDVTWGFDFSDKMNTFYAFNYILEFSTPNVFDSNIFEGLAMQLGFGFGKGEYSKTTLGNDEIDGESKILTFLMGIKYSVNIAENIYISTGLRFFVISYEEADENVGIELYLDLRFPFHENFMLILHIGPQIPSGFDSEFKITNGLSLALHF